MDITNPTFLDYWGKIRHHSPHKIYFSPILQKISPIKQKQTSKEELSLVNDKYSLTMA